MDRAVDWFPQKLQSKWKCDSSDFDTEKNLNNQFFYLEETISVFSSANNNKRKRSSQDVTPRPMMITYHKNFQSSKYGKKNKSDDVNQETSAETIKLSKMENLPLAWITCRQQNFTSRQNFTCTVFFVISHGKIILCIFMSFYISKLFCTVGSSNLFLLFLYNCNKCICTLVWCCKKW